MSKYFENFPLIRYSLDNGSTEFLMTDFFRRVKADANSILGATAYELYQLQDGDTPEIIAHKIYGDANLHWVILITNETIDPRFEWVQTTPSLSNYVREKYGTGNEYAAHHYENTSGDTVYYKAFTGTVDIGTTTSAGSSIAVVGNNTEFLTEVLTTGLAVRFGTTTTAYTIVAINSDTSITVSGAAVTVAVNGKKMIDNYSYSGITTLVTNQAYEEQRNEERRTIKVIKPQFVPNFIESFVGLLNDGDR